MAALLAEAVRAVEGAAQAKDVVSHGALPSTQEARIRTNMVVSKLMVGMDSN